MTQPSIPEIVKYVRAVSPHVDRSILAQALVIETIHLSDLPALVIPSDERDPVGIPDLKYHHARPGDFWNITGPR